MAYHPGRSSAPASSLSQTAIRHTDRERQQYARQQQIHNGALSSPPGPSSGNYYGNHDSTSPGSGFSPFHTPSSLGGPAGDLFSTPIKRTEPNPNDPTQRRIRDTLGDFTDVRQIIINQNEQKNLIGISMSMNGVMQRKKTVEQIMQEIEDNKPLEPVRRLDDGKGNHSRSASGQLHSARTKHGSQISETLPNGNNVSTKHSKASASSQPHHSSKGHGMRAGSQSANSSVPSAFNHSQENSPFTNVTSSRPNQSIPHTNATKHNRSSADSNPSYMSAAQSDRPAIPKTVITSASGHKRRLSSIMSEENDGSVKRKGSNSSKHATSHDKRIANGTYTGTGLSDPSDSDSSSASSSSESGSSSDSSESESGEEDEDAIIRNKVFVTSARSTPEINDYAQSSAQSQNSSGRYGMLNSSEDHQQYDQANWNSSPRGASRGPGSNGESHDANSLLSSGGVSAEGSSGGLTNCDVDQTKEPPISWGLSNFMTRTEKKVKPEYADSPSSKMAPLEETIDRVAREDYSVANAKSRSDVPTDEDSIGLSPFTSNASSPGDSLRFSPPENLQSPVQENRLANSFVSQSNNKKSRTKNGVSSEETTTAAPARKKLKADTSPSDDKPVLPHPLPFVTKGARKEIPNQVITPLVVGRNSGGKSLLVPNDNRNQQSVDKSKAEMMIKSERIKNDTANLVRPSVEIPTKVVATQKRMAPQKAISNQMNGSSPLDSASSPGASSHSVMSPLSVPTPSPAQSSTNKEAAFANGSLSCRISLKLLDRRPRSAIKRRSSINSEEGASCSPSPTPSPKKELSKLQSDRTNYNSTPTKQHERLQSKSLISPSSEMSKKSSKIQKESLAQVKVPNNERGKVIKEEELSPPKTKALKVEKTNESSKVRDVEKPEKESKTKSRKDDAKKSSREADERLEEKDRKSSKTTAKEKEKEKLTSKAMTDAKVKREVPSPAFGRDSSTPTLQSSKSTGNLPNLKTKADDSPATTQPSSSTNDSVSSSSLPVLPPYKAPNPLTAASLRVTGDESTWTYDNFIKIAKEKKHLADRDKDERVMQMSVYLEAVAYFVLAANTMSNSNSAGIFGLLKDTAALLSAVFKKFLDAIDREKSKDPSADDKVIFLSHRVIAILTQRQTRLRKREIAANAIKIASHSLSNATAHRKLADEAAAANKPPPRKSSSNPLRVQGGTADEPTEVIMPIESYRLFQTQLSFLSGFQSALDSWTKADESAYRHAACKTFMETLDRECGTLSLQSSLVHLAHYVRKGVQLLHDTPLST